MNYEETLRENRHVLDLALDPDLDELRRTLRSSIEEHGPEELKGAADWTRPGATRPFSNNRAFRVWERWLLDQRLVCPQWPESVGGRGWNGAQLAVFNYECHRARLPRVTRGGGEWLCGPSLIIHGTEEQKERFLAPIIRGDHVYCQGFSEPNHGSDLASVETRGVVEGNELVITGQKTWTSDAHLANMMFLLCRTDPEGPRYRNLSFVLLPMVTPGVSIRPITQITGEAEFGEVFIDEARVPLDHVVGELDNGWNVAMSTLSYERGTRLTVPHLGYEREFADLVDEARRLGRTDEPAVRQSLAWAYCQIQLMRYQEEIRISQVAQNIEPGPEASITKLFSSEYHRRIGEIAMDIGGLGSLVTNDGEDPLLTNWQRIFLASRAETIYSGTNEIQRNIIAERVLGLPKEPKVFRPRGDDTKRSEAGV